MKTEMCKIHPDVPYVVRESTSVNGGHIGWGCAVCNILLLETARRRIATLETALRKIAYTILPLPGKAPGTLETAADVARAALEPKESVSAILEQQQQGRDKP